MFSKDLGYKFSCARTVLSKELPLQCNKISPGYGRIALPQEPGRIQASVIRKK